MKDRRKWRFDLRTHSRVFCQISSAGCTEIRNKSYLHVQYVHFFTFTPQFDKISLNTYKLKIHNLISSIISNVYEKLDKRLFFKKGWILKLNQHFAVVLHVLFHQHFHILLITVKVVHLHIHFFSTGKYTSAHQLESMWNQNKTKCWTVLRALCPFAVAHTVYMYILHLS